MKQFLSIILFFLITSLAFSQERVVLNNDSFIVIDNSAFLTIDNPATTAITTVGSRGNIVSENETDVIKWNIGSNTGNYVIPWTTTSAELDLERTTDFTANTSAGAFGSMLKLTVAGHRNKSASLAIVGSNGIYWSSTANGIFTISLNFGSVPSTEPTSVLFGVLRISHFG